MVSLGVKVKSAMGSSSTIIEMSAEELQEPEVPTTVYVVFEEGLAVTELPDELLNVDGGLHEYEEAPEALKVVLSPGQRVVFVDVKLTFGLVLTVISMESLS